MEGLSARAEALLDVIKRTAAQEIMPRYLKVAHERKSDGSLCTQADIAAQDALARELSSIYACPLLAEEMSDAEHTGLWQRDAGALWCVDPIDGTTNFVNGIPYFAVSVALLEQGRPVLGAVFDPVANEAFYAEKGHGAYLNGVALPIKEMVPKSLHRAIAAVDLKRLSARLGEAIGRTPPYASHRNFGASTLDWCYVAAGRFDLYLHGGQKLWDYAAGSLILSEAGGSMCTQANDDFWAGDPWNRSVIAGLDEKLFDAWKVWVRSHQ